MKTLLPLLLLLATLLPAPATAGTGVCSSDDWDAVCLGDYRRAMGSCADDGAEREGTGVSSPFVTVAGERECHRDEASSGASESVIIHAAGVEVKWRRFTAESEGFGHQDECFLGVGGNVGSLHAGHHFVDCPAGPPPNPGWGSMVP